MFQTNEEGGSRIAGYIEIGFAAEVDASFLAGNEIFRKTQAAAGIEEYFRAVGQAETEFAAFGNVYVVVAGGCFLSVRPVLCRTNVPCSRCTSSLFNSVCCNVSSCTISPEEVTRRLPGCISVFCARGTGGAGVS